MLEHSAEEEVWAPDPQRELERTGTRAMCAMRFELQWRCEYARHTDVCVRPKLNLWRDFFPPEIEAELMDKPVGHTLEHSFPRGDLLQDYRDDDCFKIRETAFNRGFRRHNHIEPRAGRFYPKGFIAGTRGIVEEDSTAFRVARVGEEITVDLNHPLAARDTALSTQILGAWAAGDEHGGACNDVVELVTGGGPGMQARWNALATDFWSDIPFSRIATEADAAFYVRPRFVGHIDRTATRQVEQLYGRLVPPAGEVLDLMASWKSHLPESQDSSTVAGLGMNREELDANPVLLERVVHDLNLDPRLPFDDDRFDAVVCTVSVEYLVRPVEVFVEVNRVLKSGGRFIVTFSNRWFPPKVIKIWEDIHEFERPGLVLEYFLKAGGFTKLATWSMRGLPRPADDKYAGQLSVSDPIHAVWGEKQ